MKQKIKTRIYLNGDVIKIIDDFLYHPLECIIIKDIEYHKWTQYDEFESDYLVRIIKLKD